MYGRFFADHIDPITEAGRAVGVPVVPIRIGGRVEGSLYVGSRRPHVFTNYDEAILQRLADHAATTLANAQLYAEVQAGRERLQGLSRQLLEAQEAERRRLAHELRPTILDDLGLVPALRFFAEGVSARTGLRIRVDSAIDGRLAPPVEAALYRIMPAILILKF